MASGPRPGLGFLPDQDAKPFGSTQNSNAVLFCDPPALAPFPGSSACRSRPDLPQAVPPHRHPRVALRPSLAGPAARHAAHDDRAFQRATGAGVPPGRTATHVLEITPESGVPFTFAVGVQVQDRDALQAVQQGSISGSLIVKPAIWLDATGEVPVVHVGAVCLVAGRTVATLAAGPDRLEIEIASHAFDRTLDLDDVNT